MKHLIAFALILAGVMFSMPADAQGYNCRFARSPDEVLICQDERLSRLDERMNTLYSRALEEVGRRRARELEEDQQIWLRNRMRCGRSYDCIENAYRQRIDELRDYGRGRRFRDR